MGLITRIRSIDGIETTSEGVAQAIRNTHAKVVRLHAPQKVATGVGLIAPDYPPLTRPPRNRHQLWYRRKRV